MASLLPESELQQQFARRRTRQWILVLPVLAVILLMRSIDKGSSVFGLPSEVLAIVGLVLVVGAVAFTFYNWRCPACEKYLGRAINPRFCQKCGFKLRA